MAFFQRFYKQIFTILGLFTTVKDIKSDNTEHLAAFLPYYLALIISKQAKPSITLSATSALIMSDLDRAFLTLCDPLSSQVLTTKARYYIQAAKSDPHFLLYALEKALELPCYVPDSHCLIYFYLSTVDTLLDTPITLEVRKNLSIYMQFAINADLIEGKSSLLKLVASVYVKAMRTGCFEHWSEALFAVLDSCKLRDANKLLALRCLKLLVAANDSTYSSLLTGEKVSTLLNILINEPNPVISGKAAITAISLFDPSYLLENDHYILQVTTLKGSNPNAYLKCTHALTSSPIASTYPKLFVTRLHLDLFLSSWKSGENSGNLGVLCEIIREVGGWLVREKEWTLGEVVIRCGLRCLQVRENGCVWAVLKLLKQVIEQVQRELEGNAGKSTSHSEIMGDVYVCVITRMQECSQVPGSDEYYYLLKLSALSKLLLSLPFSHDFLLNYLINTPVHLANTIPALISLLQLQDLTLRKHSTQLLMSLLQANAPGSPVCLILRELQAVVSEADMLMVMAEVKTHMANDADEFDKAVVDFVGSWTVLSKEKMMRLREILGENIEKYMDELMGYFAKMTLEADFDIAEMCCLAAKSPQINPVTINTFLSSLHGKANPPLSDYLHILTQITTDIESNLTSILPSHLIPDLLNSVLDTAERPECLPVMDQIRTIKVRFTAVQFMLALTSKGVDILDFLNTKQLIAFLSGMLCSEMEKEVIAIQNAALALRLLTMTISLLNSSHDQAIVRNFALLRTFQLTSWQLNHTSDAEVMGEIAALHAAIWTLATPVSFLAAATSAIPVADLTKYEEILREVNGGNSPTAFQELKEYLGTLASVRANRK